MHHIKVESDEQDGPTSTQFEFVSVGVKQELLSETEPTTAVDTSNCVAHLDGDKSQNVKIKSETNLPEELEDLEKELEATSLPQTLLKNPVASSEFSVSSNLKVMNSKRTIDQEGDIVTLEDQKRTLTPLKTVESFTFEHDREDIADIKKCDIKMPVLCNETISETELIIKSESLYEEHSTLDDFTHTDRLYSTTEEESNENAPEDESFTNLATNVLNNPLAFSVRIVNVSTLVEEENLLQPSSQSPAVLHQQIDRPKRSSTAKQIQYRISGDMLKCYRKHRKGKPVKQLPRRSRRVNINQQCIIKRNKKTKSKSTKLKDFPQPLKLEGPHHKSRRQPNECDIATELPRPIVLKRESNFNFKHACIFTSWQLQPQVRIKRLSRAELMKVHFQAKEFRRSTHSSRTCLLESRQNLTVHNSSRNSTQHDIPFYSSEPLGTPSSSYSHCDSGTSTSGAGGNENILLEIAAERAFINNHLIVFGFSPVHFELYNDLNELCIFLKYLFGKCNLIS